MLSGGLQHVGDRAPKFATRRGEKLLSRLASARENLTASADSDGADDESITDASTLYECETCDVVYIDTAKDTCSTCGDEVVEVSSTLRPEDDRA